MLAACLLVTALPMQAHAEERVASVDFFPPSHTQMPTGRMPAPRLAPRASSPVVPVVPTPPDPGPSRRAVAITAAIVAVAGAGAGTAFGVLALHDKSTYDAHPTAAVASRGDEEAVLADVCLGGALIAGVTSAVLLLTSDEPVAPLHAPPLTVTPALSPRAAGVSVVLRF